MNARERLSAVWPLLRFQALRASGHAVIVLSSDGEITKWEALMEHRAREVGVSVGSLYRWLRVYRESGTAGLMDQPRGDKGRSHFFRRHPDAAIFVIAKMFEGLRPAAIHRALCAAWLELYPNGTAKPPSEVTLRAYVRSLDAGEAVHS